MKRLSVVVLALALIASAGAQDSGRRWVKMVLTRLADDQKKEVVVGPVWVRDSGTAHFSLRDRSGSTLVVYLSPRLTADGPMLSIWAAEGEDAVKQPPNSQLITAKMDSHTDFELAAGKFRVFVALEVPKGARQ